MSKDTAATRAQFRRLDRDGNGTLSYRELSRLLKKLNPSFSATQLQTLFCEIDANQNGKVELDEFLDFILDNKKSKPAEDREPPEGKALASDVRDEWKQATLDAHNRLRALHGCPPLTWSDECYIEAKKQANACQARGSLFHDHLQGPSGRHGQNGYWCSAPGSTAEVATESWYDEITDPGYNFDKPGFTGGTGHFTQVVWKDTTSVGMAVSEDGKFIFANYLPAGNFMGRFPENVPRPGSDAVARRPASPPPEPEPEVASGANTVTAKEMTADLEALFADCPFPFKDKAAAAFENGATVTAEREQKGNVTSLVVKIAQGCRTSKMTCSWGGG